MKPMGGQRCSITFEYCVVAQRLGYEHTRLDAMTLKAMDGSDP
jgi:hypothetical protein